MAAETVGIYCCSRLQTNYGRSITSYFCGNIILNLRYYHISRYCFKVVKDLKRLGHKSGPVHINPGDTFPSPEPCQLSSGVSSRVPFYKFDRPLQG